MNSQIMQVLPETVEIAADITVHLARRRSESDMTRASAFGISCLDFAVASVASLNANVVVISSSVISVPAPSHTVSTVCRPGCPVPWSQVHGTEGADVGAAVAMRILDHVASPAAGRAG